MRRLSSLRALAVAVIISVAVSLMPPTAPSAALPPGPPPGKGTALLDHTALLKAAGVGDQSWFEANVPFVELPDATLQNVYYYRYHTWKEHLNYLDPVNGYTSSEFLADVGYAAPGGAVVAAAGHVMHDGRWVRDRRYLDDYARYWLTGPGAAKAHQYTSWMASSLYDRYLVNGDAAFLRAQQAGLVRHYDGWQANLTDGLYWVRPVSDAMENGAADLESPTPAGYRPTINAYQWADALAIANIARLNGDATTASTFQGRAAALKTAMQQRLWDSGGQFFYHRMVNGGQLLDTREIYGLFPWYFGMPDPGHSAAWSQLVDPNGFAAPYGPTTVERRSPHFDAEPEKKTCCWWNGPSWPYATSLVLGGMARLLTEYPAQPYVDRTDFVDALRAYARTQHQDGRPFVAEAHDPDGPQWLYPGRQQQISMDYNHSSYPDLIISGLLGLRPQPDTTLRLTPLVPAGWTYFALENVPYHGHNVSVWYDKDGSRYGEGAGFRVAVDSVVRVSQAAPGPVTVDVGSTVVAAPSPLRNIAVNVNRTAAGPQPFATYTSRFDNVWRAVDGRATWHATPNTRWTSYQSPNASDSWGLNLGQATTVNHVRVYFYDDGGGVRVPTEYRLQRLSGGVWGDVPGQARRPDVPGGNGRTEITFPSISTSQLRILAPNRGGGVGWGIAEFEIWQAD